MAEKPPTSTAEPIAALKLFNEFHSQSRARGEAALKLVMGISGGLLTLSVGAVLNATPAKIPVHLLSSLQVGLGLLFFCVAASMLLMASMIVATFHMGVRWRKALEANDVAFAFVATWPLLRIANAALAFVILCSFLGGVYLVARVAIGVVGSATVVTVSSSSALAPLPAEKPSSPLVPASQVRPRKRLPLTVELLAQVDRAVTDEATCYSALGAAT